MNDLITVGLVVGHDLVNQGAGNNVGMTEWLYNSHLVSLISEKMMERTSLQPIVIFRDVGDYGGLPDKINRTGVNIAIEFHCNSYAEKPGQPEVDGCATLHLARSKQGAVLASLVQDAMLDVMGNNNRGAKGLRDGDLGYPVVRYTSMPCIITEPFFIDNVEAAQTGLEKANDLADAILDAIKEYFD